MSETIVTKQRLQEMNEFMYDTCFIELDLNAEQTATRLLESYSQVELTKLLYDWSPIDLNKCASFEEWVNRCCEKRYDLYIECLAMNQE